MDCLVEIDAIAKARDDAAKRKRRKARPVIGDLDPLINSLPVIVDEPQNSAELRYAHLFPVFQCKIT